MIVIGKPYCSRSKIAQKVYIFVLNLSLNKWTLTFSILYLNDKMKERKLYQYEKRKILIWKALRLLHLVVI